MFYRFTEPTLYFLGLLITGTELTLQTFNRSLCTAEGCKMVGTYVKGGELVLLIAKTVFFAVVFVLSLAEKRFLLPFSNFYKKPVCQKYFLWAISFFLTLAIIVVMNVMKFYMMTVDILLCLMMFVYILTILLKMKNMWFSKKRCNSFQVYRSFQKILKVLIF